MIPSRLLLLIDDQPRLGLAGAGVSSGITGPFYVERVAVFTAGASLRHGFTAGASLQTAWTAGAERRYVAGPNDPNRED